ncbi:intracellular exo-alpha-(1-_5)-L-arabinofuranosidase [Abditibacteriota bacterium]|nr:intracellular exo-alpha-(1->5)-L-arabinofuranosidase [Abditibacteriota bacterium]
MGFEAVPQLHSLWFKSARPYLMQHNVWGFAAFVLGLTSLSLPHCQAQGVPPVIPRLLPAFTVHTNQVLREGANRFAGINLDYLRDSDANRPTAKPLQNALQEMGARFLRYPGGEKSDFLLWSNPPYDKPVPTALGWYGTVPGEKLDFDRYVAIAHSVGAEPYVVVGCDSLERTGRTKEQWLENAVTWVKYANITKKYGIKYWEIGNENWHNQSFKPDEIANIVVESSRAMKAVDPSIHIGASGSGDQWWSQFLPIAAPALDFVSISHYNAWEWKSYDYLLQHPETDLGAGARQTLASIDRYAPAADRARLKLIVAETNSKDYSDGGWASTNSMGHALVTFETLGQLMQEPRIESAMVWTTRWVNDAEASQSQWYGLGPRNEIMPTGRAVALWGQFAQEKMVAVEGGVGQFRAYATRSTDNSTVTVWIVNRGHEAVSDLKVTIDSPKSYHRAEIWRLSGTGPDDTEPKWKQEKVGTLTDKLVEGLVCPGVSVSVVVLRH